MKTYIRKKDGARFRTDLSETRFVFSRESVNLRPAGDQWPLVLRSHWKGVTAFREQYTNLDGSPITE